MQRLAKVPLKKGLHLIRHTSVRQMSLEGFTLLFDVRLNPENHWVKLNRRIPWDNWDDQIALIRLGLDIVLGSGHIQLMSRCFSEETLFMGKR